MDKNLKNYLQEQLDNLVDEINTCDYSKNYNLVNIIGKLTDVVQTILKSTNTNLNPSPEQQARIIANISPKAKIDNQPFEARIAYYAALKMYEWIKESNL